MRRPQRVKVPARCPRPVRYVSEKEAGDCFDVGYRCGQLAGRREVAEQLDEIARYAEGVRPADTPDRNHVSDPDRNTSSLQGGSDDQLDEITRLPTAHTPDRKNSSDELISTPIGVEINDADLLALADAAGVTVPDETVPQVFEPEHLAAEVEAWLRGT